MKQGMLEVICGPMFAGKSTMLIERLEAAERAGRPTLACKPLNDTRYGHAVLSTHAGVFHAASPIRATEEITALAGHALAAGAAGLLVAVDEAHFFGDALLAPVRSLLTRGVDVLVAGVALDHRGEPFPPFPTLVCEAEAVFKLAAPCAVCGGRAIHSQRMIEGDATIVVGGAESYQARCRSCFNPAPPSR